MFFALRLTGQVFAGPDGQRRFAEYQVGRPVQGRLVLLDHHQVVSVLAADLLGQRRLRQQGIHRGDGAGQVAAGQQLGRHGDLVGLAVDRSLPQHITALVAHQTHQEGVRAVGAGAAHVFRLFVSCTVTWYTGTQVGNL